MNGSKPFSTPGMIPPTSPPPGTSKKFLSLRTKFSLFVSLVIILVCSGLSGFLIQQEAEGMRTSLKNTGTILVKTLSRVSANRLIVQDVDYLNTMLDGAISAPEVVYALVTDPKGNILASKSKGPLTDWGRLSRRTDLPQFPDSHVLQAWLATIPDQPVTEPIISILQTNRQNTGILRPPSKMPRTAGATGQVQEIVYDLALPVYRVGTRSTTLELLSSETLEDPAQLPSPSSIIGVIQVGMTTAIMQRKLNDTVWHIGFITIGIIVSGIILTFFLASRIVIPLRRLAGAAQKIAGGDLAIAISAETEDEVGQLTSSINQMVQSLQQRETSIAHYVSTITRQITQLSTLHQTSTAITATLNIERLLSTVLKSLQENLGFKRMILVSFAAQYRRAEISEVTGISPDMVRQIKGRSYPVGHGTLDESLLIQGRPVLAFALHEVAPKMNPVVLSACQQVGVISFVAAPLISHQRILGYLGGDKGEHPCTQEDLDLLMTIASHVAIALDNAQTYQQLEQLAQNLEQRVSERTQELQNANERLQELDRLKSAFVSIVSHELRTPMTSIKGLIENMMDGLTGNMNERQTFYLERVKHNIERLTRMINDLLDLSRIESGRMELQRSAVNIGSLGREVVELFQPLAREQSITLETQIDDALPLTHGDRDKLIQILTNLVNNALKFTESSGTVTVTVKQLEEGWIQTCVADTGCGISLEDQRTLFEPFYRTRAADQKKAGAGLGLAISKSLVELHGGRIWVESAPEQGSRFCFTIPVSEG